LTDLQQAIRDGAASESERVGADLTLEQILAWADAYHAAHGAWPDVKLMAGAGPVDGVPGEWWKAIDHAPVFGLRGLPGDLSLAERRGAAALDMETQALAEKIRDWA
jgi:hypothetical protein